MTYNLSQLDKDNIKWFEHDNSRQSLAHIALKSGAIRGLTPFSIQLDYPITVFSGTNGSGKSTMLALAACAFHNDKAGYTPPLRMRNYYTFQDFFIQNSEEKPIEGIELNYGIRHNNWNTGKPRLGYQTRKKKKAGKWNDYSGRVDRNVIYFGVQRVVPHFERSVHKAYRSRFKPGRLSPATRERIATIASRVVGKKYTDFDSYVHSKYSLPFVEASGITYSGFNMGAGESAVFEIFTSLFQAGSGALLIIDEIELGLHELAQLRLIEQLKLICSELKCQIICSSHSHSVLRSLPPDARFHIEKVDGRTFITKGISADFACGKMGKPDAFELDIFVEDGVAAELLQSILPLDVRRRTRVKVIGSHSAVMRQLASRYLEKVDSCICVLDGDQSSENSQSIKVVETACEASTNVAKQEIEEWSKKRIFYLPGSEWPERWVIDTAIKLASIPKSPSIDQLVDQWGLSTRTELLDALNTANSAGKHKEFFELSQAVELAVEKVRSDVIALVVGASRDDVDPLVDAIRSKLP